MFEIYITIVSFIYTLACISYCMILIWVILYWYWYGIGNEIGKYFIHSIGIGIEIGKYLIHSIGIGSEIDTCLI